MLEDSQGVNLTRHDDDDMSNLGQVHVAASVLT